jgi:mono/diheme cytochrome c family protein
VVVPGAPESSELVRRIEGKSLPRMPLNGPPYLSDEEIASIRAWIAAGAPGGRVTRKLSPGRSGTPGPGELVTYRHVERVLLKRCLKCHMDNGQMGPAPEGLRLGSLVQVLAGGERVVVIPGRPGASELFRRVAGKARPRMPFDGPPYLSDEDIRLIGDWIAAGAPDDDGARAPVPVGARVRLRGVLTARWALDGEPILVGVDTRMDKGPAVGQGVEVRGVVTADGRIRATRIRAR